MDNNKTEIVFILDRSGSMYELTNDTIGGYNSYIESQKEVEGSANLTTVLFDDKYEVLHDGIDIKDVKPLTTKEYFTRGSTALLDAIGKTLATVGDRLANTDEDKKPGKVLVVITTDGYENSSKEYTQKQIKDIIDLQTSRGWQFIFLGANVDSFDVAKGIGIAMASNYSPTQLGTQSIYSSLVDTTTSYRNTGTISDSWNDNIE